MHSARIILITRCLQLLMPLRDRAVQRECSFPPITSWTSRRILRTLNIVALTQIKNVKHTVTSAAIPSGGDRSTEGGDIGGGKEAGGSSPEQSGGAPHVMQMDDFVDLIDGRLLSSILSFYSDTMGGDKNSLPDYNQDPVLICTVANSPAANAIGVCVDLLHQRCASTTVAHASWIPKFIAVVDGFEQREATWLVPPPPNGGVSVARKIRRTMFDTMAKDTSSVLPTPSHPHTAHHDSVLAWPQSHGSAVSMREGSDGGGVGGSGSSFSPVARSTSLTDRTLDATLNQFRSKLGGWKQFTRTTKLFLARRSMARFQLPPTIKVATERLRKLASLCWAERQALMQFGAALCPQFDSRILAACVGEVMAWWPRLNRKSGASPSIPLDARSLLDSTAQLLASFGCGTVASYIGARIGVRGDKSIEAAMARFLHSNGTSLAEIQLGSCEWAIGSSSRAAEGAGQSLGSGDDADDRSFAATVNKNIFLEAVGSARREFHRVGIVVVVCANAISAELTHAELVSLATANYESSGTVQLIAEESLASRVGHEAHTIVVCIDALLAMLLSPAEHNQQVCGKFGVVLLHNFEHIVRCTSEFSHRISQLVLAAPCAMRLVDTRGPKSERWRVWMHSVLRAMSTSPEEGLDPEESGFAAHDEFCGVDQRGETDAAAQRSRMENEEPRREQAYHLFDPSRCSLQRIHPFALMFDLRRDGVATHFPDVLTESMLRERLAAIPSLSPAQCLDVYRALNRFFPYGRSSEAKPSSIDFGR
tara:strand:- start:185 stop:2476 length:2292 start_codon:yes stop_codon:yes gene_type:complete